jgi:hypothetical protein
VVDTLVEQAGIDLGRCLVGKAWRMQQIENHLPLRDGQCPRGCRPPTWDHCRCDQTGAPALHAGS